MAAWGSAGDSGISLDCSLSGDGSTIPGKVSGDFSVRMRRIRSLYENNMYSSAKREINAVLRDGCGIGELQEAELATYSILCDIALGNENLDGLMIEYGNRFAYAPEYMRVRFMYADHYFRQGNYVRALELLDDVSYPLLSKDDKPKYLFERSFSQLRTGLTKQSRSGFDNLLSMPRNPYTASATYYRGYIYYIDKDFDNAVRLLSSIRNHERFGPYCKYYILESKLMSGDYAFVVKNAADVFAAVGEEMKPKVAKIVSQAYFKQGSSEEAKEWFEKYSASGGKMSRKDNYYFGVISYSLDSYIPAIDAFLKVVAEEQDSLTQNAYLHIGNSYLNLKNKLKALDAYKAAAMMDIPGEVKEDAFFHYAKLAFDLNSDITPFNDYLDAYPKSAKADEIHSYIATSYLLRKQYKSAIDALNKIRKLTPEMDVNLQKAAFLRALELFGRGSYRGAITDFNIALKHSSYNQSLTLLTRFWLAEAYYRTGNIEDAIKINSALYENSRFRGSREYTLLLFNQGYCYFMKEDYPSAVEWFRRFQDQHYTNMSLIIESKIRMADAYFMMQEYEKAAIIYEEVSIINYDSDQVVYAAYQAGISYGLISMTDKKVEKLKGIMGKNTSSPLYSAAVYELGRTYAVQEDYFNAERCFKYLLEEVNDPVYTGKAMLELGMLYSNQSKYDEALVYLTRIVETLPLSEDTENALAVMESIYVTLNRPEDFIAYLDRVGMSSRNTPDENELMIFNAAERVYLSGNFSDAEKQLRSFVSKYPEGQKTSLAYFYLGETLALTGKKEEALAAYTEVMERGEGSFVEISTLKFAGICYELQRYEDAATAYNSLYSIAKLENNRYEAMLGGMRSYFHGEKYLSAIESASRLLGAPEIRPDDKTEGEYVLAKCYMVLGRRTDALPILKRLSSNVFSPYGAEANYLLIQDSYDSGQFEEVENLVYAFSDSQTDQTYWLAKSFIVLGDSFAEREEWEQAEATFKSILDGYEPVRRKDDVKDQVRMRLEKIEEMKKEL